MTKYDETQLLFTFLAHCVQGGRMSMEESVEILGIYREVVQTRAGFTNSADRTDHAFQAVERHARKLMIDRILELHPDLKDRLAPLIDPGHNR